MPIFAVNEGEWCVLSRAKYSNSTDPDTVCVCGDGIPHRLRAPLEMTTVSSGPEGYDDPELVHSGGDYGEPRVLHVDNRV